MQVGAEGNWSVVDALCGYCVSYASFCHRQIVENNNNNNPSLTAIMQVDLC